MGKLKAAKKALDTALEARLVRFGYPDSTARKIASGELPMDEMSRMERAYDQSYLDDAYHGSTHDIGDSRNPLDATRTQAESDMGQGIYATNSQYDVNTNYAGEGPDLTNRIQRRAEMLADEMGLDYDAAEVMAAARKAEKGGNQGVVYPLKVNTDDYARMGGDNPTRIEVDSQYDEALEQIKDEVPDFDPDNYDHQDLLSERQYELQADDMDHPMLKLRDAVSRNQGDPAIVDNIYFEDGADVSEIYEALKEGYFEDDAGELASAGQVLSDFLSDMGYKGIVDHTAPGKFAQMNAGEHIVAFPGGEHTMRSRFAAFDPDKTSASNLLAGIGGAAVLAGATAPGQAEASPITEGGKRIHVRDMATPGMLGATAATGAAALSFYEDDPDIDPIIDRRITAQELRAATGRFLQKQQSRKAHWDGLRQDLMATMQPLVEGANFALEAIEIPMKGIHGLTAVAGDLAAGNSLQDALSRGGSVARQPLEQTAQQQGDAVFNATGSPALGATAYTGTLFADVW